MYLMNEKQLITAYLKGDEEAIKLLIDCYLQEVYLYFLKRTSNSMVAEDLTQETFIKMWRNLKKFDLDKNFRSWLFTIAKNTFIDYLRKNYHKGGLLKEIVFSEFEDEEKEMGILNNFVIDHSLIFETIDQKEQISKINQILDTLPKNDKKLFEYRLNGLKFNELAKIFNTSVNTIKSRYHRLIQKIKEKI